MLLYKTATKSQFLRNISILSKYNDFRYQGLLTLLGIPIRH